MDKHERIANALRLRSQGYNCAQCVSMTFDPSLEVASAGLGTGVAGTGHICGAASAMALVESSFSYSGPEAKQNLYAAIRGHLARFAALNGGDTACSALRKPGRKDCAGLIADAVGILHDAHED